MAEPFATSIEVELNGELFKFSIPNMHEEIRIGVRMKEIRRALGDFLGDTDTLDFSTVYSLRACATFDTLLQAGPKWCFVAAEKGDPKVDSAKFPPEKVDAVIESYGKYVDKLQSFRKGGNPTQPPAP